MEIIGTLEKDGQRTVTTQTGSFNVGQYHVNGLGDRPNSICFEVLDGDKGRIATFDKFAKKVCKVNFTVNVRLYNGRMYNDVRGWAVTNVSNE